MLDNVAVMFDDMKNMMKHLKKKNYESNTKLFQEQYGHYFREMTEYLENAEDKDEAAKEIATTFIQSVKEKFIPEKKKHMPSYQQTDVNLFMIYYVFPAILMTNHEDAKIIADTLCSEWGKSFKDSKIGYTTYDELYVSFREKIFGIF